MNWSTSQRTRNLSVLARQLSAIYFLMQNMTMKAFFRSILELHPAHHRSDGFSENFFTMDPILMKKGEWHMTDCLLSQPAVDAAVSTIGSPSHHTMPTSPLRSSTQLIFFRLPVGHNSTRSP